MIEWWLASTITRLILCSITLLLWLRSTRLLINMPPGPRLDIILYAFTWSQPPHVVHVIAHLVASIRDLIDSAVQNGQGGEAPGPLKGGTTHDPPDEAPNASTISLLIILMLV
jgi:hypothetical protein